MKEEKLNQLIEKQIKRHSQNIDIKNSVMLNIKKYEKTKKIRLYYFDIILAIFTFGSLLFSIFLTNYILTPLKFLTFLYNPLNIDTTLVIWIIQGIFCLFIILTLLIIRYFYINNKQKYILISD